MSHFILLPEKKQALNHLTFSQHPLLWEIIKFWNEQPKIDELSKSVKIPRLIKKLKALTFVSTWVKVETEFKPGREDCIFHRRELKSTEMLGKKAQRFWHSHTKKSLEIWHFVLWKKKKNRPFQYNAVQTRKNTIQN